MNKKPLTNKAIRQQTRQKKAWWRSVLFLLGYVSLAYVGYEPIQDWLIGMEVTMQTAHYGYLGLVVGLRGLPWLFYIRWLGLPAAPRKVNEYKAEQHRLEQKQLTAVEAKKLLLMGEVGVPLASLTVNQANRDGKMIGLPFNEMEGHVLVVGNTGSGKGMHLTETLLHYPGAMVVIDPKGEQYERTAGFRQQLGPVYNIPQQTLDLADYYDLGNRDDVAELHYHLIKPWADKQPVFANMSKTLFTAAYAYAQHHSLNPIQVLFDMADSDPATALSALLTVNKDAVMAFTNGRLPDEMDRMSGSAWGTFTNRMYEYQAHVPTITTQRRYVSVPLDWAEQNATIYITYSFDQLKGVGGVVSAIVAALMRYQIQTNAKIPLLVAVDELPTVGLRNVETYLSIVRGYKVSLLLYIQAYSQLVDDYGENKAQTILSNCQHQVWYPPTDTPTARRIEELYGTELRPSLSTSQSLTKERMELDLGKRGNNVNEQWQRVAALASNQVTALDEEEVVLRVKRKYVVRGYRLWPVPRLGTLPPLRHAVKGVQVAKQKTDWEKPVKGEEKQVKSEAVAQGNKRRYAQ